MGKNRNKRKAKRKQKREKEQRKQNQTNVKVKATNLDFGSFKQPPKKQAPKKKVKLTEIAKPYNIGKYLMVKIMVSYGTQKAFSEFVNVDLQKIVDVGSGKKIPTEDLDKILTALNISENDLDTKKVSLVEDLTERLSVYKNVVVPKERIEKLIELR